MSEIPQYDHLDGDHHTHEHLGVVVSHAHPWGNKEHDVNAHTPDVQAVVTKTIKERVFRYAGSVSHGTLRTVDLIPAFMDVLREIDPEAAGRLAEDERRFLNALDGTYDEDPDYTDAQVEALVQQANEWLNEDLWPAMERAAPEGYSFGAHEGDGSDIGYWQVDEDDEDEGDLEPVNEADTEAYLAGHLEIPGAVETEHGLARVRGPQAAYDPRFDSARVDEVRVRSIIGFGSQWAAEWGGSIVQQGRFRCGGQGTYASVEVLARRAGLPEHEAYSTHTAIVRAEPGREPVVVFERGDYDLTRAQAEDNLAGR